MAHCRRGALAVLFPTAATSLPTYAKDPAALGGARLEASVVARSPGGPV